MNTAQRVCVLLAAGAFVGCSNPSDDETSTLSPRQVGAEETLFASADPHLAFTASGAGFTAATPFQRAEVDAGVIRMTPVNGGSAVSFATAGISRGADDLAVGVLSTRADAGQLAIERASATELLDNRAAGLEQSWRFTAAPRGNGDLSVAVAVAGHATVKTTDAGLVFATKDGGGFRYSHAAWVDAEGTTWDVPARWDGREIVMTVPSAVLAASAYPAVLDPTITNASSVDTPIFGFTGRRGREPSVAWSTASSRYLAVWRDDRLSSESDIFGTRLEVDGEIIDASGVEINAATGIQSEPVVAFPGTGQLFVVAWTDLESNIAAATVSGGGATATVSQLGNIAATGAVETNPAIGSNGNGAIVVWQSDGNVRGARFLEGGTFGAAFDIAATGNTEAAPTIAGATGGGYLVAWQEGDTSEDIRGQLLNADGSLNGAAFDISTGTARRTLPAASYNGTDYVLVWAQSSDIMGARVSTTGTVVDTGVTISATANVQTEPAVDCATASCLVSWQERIDTTSLLYNVYAQQTGLDLTLSGGVLNIGILTNNQIRPSITSAGANYGVVWEDNRTGVQMPMFSRVSGGAVQDGNGVILTTTKANAQQTPVYARTMTSQTAVWSDSRAIGDDVYARRYSGTGAKLDTGAIAISTAVREQGSPSVDWDGVQYTVVWQDHRTPTWDIRGARFQESGTVNEATGFTVSNAASNQLRPDIASGGGVSLVVWEDSRSGVDTDLYAAILTTSGTVSVNNIAVCATTGEQLRPAVAWDPTSSVFVVAWLDERAGVGAADIYAARVQPSGAVLDACGVVVSGAANDQRRPSIATSGSQLLVAWVDFRSDPTNMIGDVYGSRVTTSGGLNVLDPGGIALATTASSQGEPTVGGIVDGTWGVVWTDDVDFATSGNDLYGNTVLANGSLAGATYPVSVGTAESESAPSFQAGVNVKTFLYLVYERIGYIGSTRVARRKITYP